MRKLLLSAAFVCAVPLATPSIASPKPCRNAAGKIIECPKPPRKSVQRCKDTTGKFVPCDKAGAKPAVAQR